VALADGLGAQLLFAPNTASAAEVVAVLDAHLEHAFAR
jgi:hypothetical protein